MRSLLPISVSLLLVWQAARGQSAGDYFNSGAHAYISNNIPQALESVETGLKQYPDDVKLKKLYELLKQQNQQQSQNSQSQKNQNQQSQQNQSQQQQSQKNQQNQQQSQQNSQQQKQNKQNQSGQKNAGPQNPQRQQAAGEKQENQTSQNQSVSVGQMTPEEAKRLLDAQKGDEQFLQLKPSTPPQNRQPPIEDW
jgi:Ca-activated chloride channel family protein